MAVPVRRYIDIAAIIAPIVLVVIILMRNQQGVPTSSKPSMSATTGTTFEVDDVQSYNLPLSTRVHVDDMRAHLEAFNHGTESFKPPWDDELDGYLPKPTIWAHAPFTSDRIGGHEWSIVEFKDGAYGGTNGFLRTILYAWQHHLPLVLTPDHIWLLIVQAVSRHINTNSEALRHRFVAHEGQKVIHIKSSSLDWEWAFGQFGREIKKETHASVYERLVGDGIGSFSSSSCRMAIQIDWLLVDNLDRIHNKWTIRNSFIKYRSNGFISKVFQI
jgi:hypothetical protein